MANVVNNQVLKVSKFHVSNMLGTTYSYCCPYRMKLQFPNVDEYTAKQADVYSFAIVMYAVLENMEPWS